MTFSYGNTVVQPGNSYKTGNSHVPHERRKLVVVGGGGTGKTSLLMVHCRQTFPQEYVPTVFENFVKEEEVDKKLIDLALWDTAGQEDYDRLRPLSYPDSDIVLLCFSVTDRGSFSEILTKWNPEVSHFLDGVPKLLVGLKTDLREQTKDAVTYAEAQELAYRIGACYVECSAKRREGVEQVFQTAIKTVWENDKRVSRRRRQQKLKKLTSRCCIM